MQGLDQKLPNSAHPVGWRHFCRVLMSIVFVMFWCQSACVLFSPGRRIGDQSCLGCRMLQVCQCCSLRLPIPCHAMRFGSEYQAPFDGRSCRTGFSILTRLSRFVLSCPFWNFPEFFGFSRFVFFLFSAHSKDMSCEEHSRKSLKLKRGWKVIGTGAESAISGRCLW